MARAVDLVPGVLGALAIKRRRRDHCPDCARGEHLHHHIRGKCLRIVEPEPRDYVCKCTGRGSVMQEAFDALIGIVSSSDVSRVGMYQYQHGGSGSWLYMVEITTEDDVIEADDAELAKAIRLAAERFEDWRIANDRGDD